MAGGEKGEDKQLVHSSPAGLRFGNLPKSAENLHGRDSMFFRQWEFFAVSVKPWGEREGGLAGQMQKQFAMPVCSYAAGGKPVSAGFRLRNETKRSAGRRARVAWPRGVK